MEYIYGLFLESLRDLEEKTKNPDVYKMIKAAALLRQLILDGGSSLAIQANRNFRIPLRFNVYGKEGYKLPADIRKGTIMRWDPPHPGNDPKNHYVTLDGFLSRIVLMWDKYDFTVKNFISVGANILGGVHISSPTSFDKLDELDRMLIAVGSKIIVNDKQSLLVSLCSISKVTIEGLLPLKEKIESGGGIEPQS